MKRTNLSILQADPLIVIIAKNGYICEMVSGLPKGLTFFILNRMNSVPTDHTSKIRALADQAAKGGPSYVVDVEVKGAGGSPIIWVYIDAEVGQATIEDCTRISRELGLLMDAHELYGDGNYTLNVSTPGLSRPLSDMRQYRNNIGRNARVKTRADDKTNIFEGKLQSFDDDGLVLDTKKGLVELKFADIIETKILPAW